MKLQDILDTINQVDYEPHVDEVVVPIADLNRLRREIINLRKSLSAARTDALNARAESFKLLAKAPLIPKLSEYM